MILFDTDTLTHFAHGNANVRRKTDELGGDEELAVTVITRYEVLRGRADSLLKAANEDELRRAAERFRQAEEMLLDLRVVGFDEDAIGHFGRLGKQKNLKKVGRADCLSRASLWPTTPCSSRGTPGVRKGTRLGGEKGVRKGTRLDSKTSRVPFLRWSDPRRTRQRSPPHTPLNRPAGRRFIHLGKSVSPR
jgi:tRNA(fMet)-specific endonuclease VapC